MARSYAPRAAAADTAPAAPCSGVGDPVRCAGVPPLLQVADFSLRRADGWSVALPAMVLQPGEVAALYGPSGCGKTSVLQGLFGLHDEPSVGTAGRVQVRGLDLAAMSAAERRHLLGHDVAFLLQDAHSALDPLQPVGRQIAQATHRGADAAVQALRELGVDDAPAVAARLPHQISGGQAQRALLAVAFLRKPAVVVADEPSSSLDGGSYAELLVQMRRLIDGGSAVLMATHDHRLLVDLRANVFAVQDGRFLPGSPARAPWPRRQPGLGVGTVPVLAAHAIALAFGGRAVLDGVDFALCRGEVVAITGESGAGKTTFGRVLAGHLRPDRGRVDRPARRAAVQLLFQDALASLTPGRTLRSLLAEAQAPFFDVEATAGALQLPAGVLLRPALRMSGGERRRSALLRALAVQPDVLVLDEPTASLDREAAAAVLEVLLELQRERGLALVLITHDAELARAVADRVLAVQGGRLCAV
jgi:peptide/nickel transport system ATP-binding protein